MFSVWPQGFLWPTYCIWWYLLWAGSSCTATTLPWDASRHDKALSRGWIRWYMLRCKISIYWPFITLSNYCYYCFVSPFQLSCLVFFLTFPRLFLPRLYLVCSFSNIYFVFVLSLYFIVLFNPVLFSLESACAHSNSSHSILHSTPTVKAMTSLTLGSSKCTLEWQAGHICQKGIFKCVIPAIIHVYWGNTELTERAK